MLIEKSIIVVNDIVTFKLINGQEVVGKLLTNLTDLSSNGVLKINKPVVIEMQMVGPSQAALGFAPYLGAANEDSNVEFYISSLLSKPLKARDDIANGYRSATGSIVVANEKESSLILGR